jgi:DNA polymerase I-like protein with 3'-5' exonuclease and polymerase domains
MIQTAIFDLESNGLLDTMTRVHCLVIRDFERRKTLRFRRNDLEDTIDEGLDLLENAETVVGHNIIHFDIPALEKVYDGIRFNGKIRDTLPLARMVFADQKDKDFRLFERGKLPGKLIGSHTLDAWGWRLGLHKGSYQDDCEEKGIDPWANWNPDLEDYNVNDVDVTVLLWDKILKSNWSHEAIVLESTIHDLMGQQERNGIYFNVPAAEKLAEELEDASHSLEQKAIEHYGKWWAPAKKRIVKALWDDDDGINKAKKYAPVYPQFGESLDRAVWAEITLPARSVKFKDVLRGDRTEGAPFCAVVCKEFNPGSRQQIVDRFATVYNWHPVDFTEKGNPQVSDDVLRRLGEDIPMAHELAEVFYYSKRLGQLKTGPGAWLKKVTPEGLIHAYVNCGGTISGRASHVSPNLGQVPAVMVDKSGILKGRAGDHGYECRELFYVPEPFVMTGIDLSGIELRCLGEKLSKYDGGTYLDIILNGDPHTFNQGIWELPTRGHAKTAIYAFVYGAGDIKLGSIVAPLASEEEQKKIGAHMRQLMMTKLPAFKALMQEVQGYARKGYIPGLDGRRLYVRSKHSALNTWLQSDAALIAKKWVCLTEEYLLDAGLEQGWDADFVFLLWIHDEEQLASRGLLNIIEGCAKRAAADAGLHFGYKCPIAAEAKHGFNWATTH